MFSNLLDDSFLLNPFLDHNLLLLHSFSYLSYLFSFHVFLCYSPSSSHRDFFYSICSINEYIDSISSSCYYSFLVQSQEEFEKDIDSCDSPFKDTYHQHREMAMEVKAFIERWKCIRKEDEDRETQREESTKMVAMIDIKTLELNAQSSH